MPHHVQPIVARYQQQDDDDQDSDDNHRCKDEDGGQPHGVADGREDLHNSSQARYSMVTAASVDSSREAPG